MIKGSLMWTSWRPGLKIWAYGLKFMNVFMFRRSLLRILLERP